MTQKPSPGIISSLDTDVIEPNEYDADTMFAWNRPNSELWCFGAVYSAESGMVFVLDPTQDAHECVTRTKAVADPLQECALVVGAYEHVQVFIKHTEDLLVKCKSPEHEIEAFNSVLGMYQPLLKTIPLQNRAIAASSPTVGKYPANISLKARVVWDDLLRSSKYLSAIAGVSGIAKWHIASKLFLNKCHRLNVTPFHTDDSKNTVDELTVKYARHRNLAALLERQIFSNMTSEGLVEDLDRGLWKFARVDYIDNRYAIVLETRWLSATKQPSKLSKYIVDEEHFQHAATGGWEHTVSPACKLQLRIKRYPNVSLCMILFFAKDALTELGVVGKNRQERLENFHDIAVEWARRRKFKKHKVAAQ